MDTTHDYIADDAEESALVALLSQREAALAKRRAFYSPGRIAAAGTATGVALPMIIYTIMAAVHAYFH
jgi:hypothetical protein